MEQATQDGEALCFTDSFQCHCCRRSAGAGACDRPEGRSTIGAIRQLDDVTYDTAFEPPVSDYELDGLDLER